MRSPNSWDLDCDVVVAGYGFAGAVSAIYAFDAGAKTVILEKTPHFGGNSILSGGGVAVADDAEDAIHYLRRTCLDTADDDLIKMFAGEMAGLRGMIKAMAAEVGFPKIDDTRRGGTYPFPGSATFANIH